LWQGGNLGTVSLDKISVQKAFQSPVKVLRPHTVRSFKVLLKAASENGSVEDTAKREADAAPENMFAGPADAPSLEDAPMATSDTVHESRDPTAAEGMKERPYRPPGPWGSVQGLGI
jgi:hypothetical protein